MAFWARRFVLFRGAPCAPRKALRQARHEFALPTSRFRRRAKSAQHNLENQAQHRAQAALDNTCFCKTKNASGSPPDIAGKYVIRPPRRSARHARGGDVHPRTPLATNSHGATCRAVRVRGKNAHAVKHTGPSLSEAKAQLRFARQCVIIVLAMWMS